ncbi:hypothetical protein FHX82_001826 [Amycolatopsis bartoniae]|uniref:Uncharacterized protein n=1 Tax=Amycolatopsis bartoniae TaxID=941986 RepID=A0A8H9M431_9PSEU|nr:hypothetical protein [Amycolatopsis bartoniae]MBB2934806.1 hypothetical protein [Amycolatopsis bartoniae]TVT03052.1 hypothetical protein FNH07_26025 [Amycolatopsis bartoniae]GHF44617.1 hypothetical protein GCM10017566_17000 [Amycolatopsis bartoniae]
MPDDNRDDDRPPRPEGRRSLDAIFGEVLPETTSDERDPDSRGDDRERWYRENRPPHHDR